jgi:selenocysteine lyase/cysteine desulfurase
MTAWVAVAQALQFQKYLCSGYRDYIEHVANEGHRVLCGAWRVEPIVPLPIHGGIFAVRLPGTMGTGHADALHLQAVLAREGVHVGVVPLPVRSGPNVLAARVTVAVYTDLSDIKRLALTVLQHAITTL